MSESSNCVMTGNDLSAEQLANLRTWRALFSEAYGTFCGIERFRFLLGMTVEEALAALNLGDSAWAKAEWTRLHEMMA